MEKTYKHFNKEGKAVNVTVPKKPSASRVARAKSAGSFYDKLRKGITGDKTEIVKGAQSIKEGGSVIPDHQKHWDVGVKHGKEAFTKGHTAPAQDKQAMSYIKTISGPVKKGSATEVYMRGWHRGHALANLQKESEEFNYGDKVHLGLRGKGGAGMFGTVHKFHGDDQVEVKSKDTHYNGITKKHEHKYWKGPRSYLTKSTFHVNEEELTPMQQANHALLSRPKLDPKKYVSAFHPNVEKARKMIADANKPKNEDVYAKVTDPKHDETKKQMSDVKKKISKVKVDKEGHTVGIREGYDNIERHPTKKGYHSGYSADGSHWLIKKDATGEYSAHSTHGKGYLKSRMGLKALSHHLKKVDKHGNSDPISKNYYDKPYDKHAANEAVMNYGAPARDTNAGHADVKKPPGYGSPARGGDGNGLGRSSVSKPPGYGSPAKDLTPGTRVGGKAVKVESEGKALRDVIREGEEDERRRTFTAKYGVTGGTMASHGALLPATHRYSKDAVDAAIASSNRAGQKIGGKEAKKIHALLKGWRG